MNLQGLKINNQAAGIPAYCHPSRILLDPVESPFRNLSSKNPTRQGCEGEELFSRGLPGPIARGENNLSSGMEKTGPHLNRLSRQLES